MEFENGSQTVESTETAPIETAALDTQDTTEATPETTPATTQESPQAFKVKYNKEEVEVPYEQAPDFIQKGMNYEKVQGRASELENHLNRVVKLSGYESHDEMLQALDQLEQQQKAQQEAQKMGIDEETYNQYFSPVNDELNKLKTEIDDFRMKDVQRQIETELNELQKDENFPKYEADMYEVATKYGMPLKEAFEFVSLRDLKNNLPNIQQQTEQKVMDQIRARQGKHVETSDNNVAIELGLTPEEIQVAQKMGVSPEEYAKWK